VYLRLAGTAPTSTGSSDSWSTRCRCASTCGAGATFVSLLDHVHERHVDALDHAVPEFDSIVDRLAVTRKPGVNPVFQVWFNDLSQAAPPPEVRGLRVGAPRHPDWSRAVRRQLLTCDAAGTGTRWNWSSPRPARAPRWVRNSWTNACSSCPRRSSGSTSR